MALSGAQIKIIQDMVEGASKVEQDELWAKAELYLVQIRHPMQTRLLTPDEERRIGIAVETLVWIECSQTGKGFWYRGKRRKELVRLYLG